MNLRLPFPEIGRQSAFNAQMIELKLNRGDVFWKITSGVTCAHMQPSHFAPFALSFYYHNQSSAHLNFGTFGNCGHAATHRKTSKSIRSFGMWSLCVRILDPTLHHLQIYFSGGGIHAPLANHSRGRSRLFWNVLRPGNVGPTGAHKSCLSVS